MPELVIHIAVDEHGNAEAEGSTRRKAADMVETVMDQIAENTPGRSLAVTRYTLTLDVPSPAPIQIAAELDPTSPAAPVIKITAEPADAKIPQ
ncbi:MAG: hypothetical protein GY866_31175 [Proteobacteria bacterium]|nr:hypothetical protein [Pseudomonadota bacterium]